MSSVRSALSIATPSEDEEGETEAIPLRTKILNVVERCPDYTIRPAKLSQELGLSIADASAELCGLLQVCRPGSSSFRFETIDGSQTMVFVFPPDVARQAAASERQEDWKDRLWMTANLFLKAVKLFTAFGLIVSTVIVSIAGVAAMVAALVALSRGGGDSRNARNQVSRQLRNLFVTLRQLLWCYAVFGPAEGGGDDPFLREAAYDTSLALSLCCGNPGSFWFWIRARQLQERRRRRRRGWARSIEDHQDDSGLDSEGVRLIRRGSWGGEETLPVPSAENRGLLSVAVEFLFGSTVPSGPSEVDKWRLRNAVIVQKSTGRENAGLALQEFMPYADAPPASLDDAPTIMSEGLLVVSHFHGLPVKSSSDASTSEKNDAPSKALFRFPELISESHVATRQIHDARFGSVGDLNRGTFDGFFFCARDSPEETFGESHRENLPSHLLEERKVFSRLTSKEFFHCLLIAILNLIGVVWFGQSLDPGGVLHDSLGDFGAALKWGLVPVLSFYAKLFFVLPSIRMGYLLAWNKFCRRRNLRRAHLASLLADRESR